MLNQKNSIQNKEANIIGKNCRLKLTSLNDQTLLFQTKLLAQKERNISIQVIRHLSEIESRKLHLKRGFSSLFDYTVKELGYSHSSAYRRIKAMRLCREMPETTTKLKTGELNLTTVSQLQTFFEKQNRKNSALLKHTKQQDYQTNLEIESQSKSFLTSTTECGVFKANNKTELQSGGLPAPAAGCVIPESKEKANNLKFDHNQKLELLKKIEGKSSRQTEKLLCDVDPEVYQAKEKVRYLKDQIEIKFTLNKNAYENIERLKHLMSHKNPNMSYQELFSILAEMGLKKYDPRQKLKKKKSSRADQTKTGQFIQKVQVKNNTPAKIKGSAISKQFIFENKNIQAKIKHPPKCEDTDMQKQSRYISTEIRRLVWTRDHGECTYICFKTKKKCRSKHLLQIDHIHPYSLGGSSRPDNLRLLCAGHNQYRSSEGRSPRNIGTYMTGSLPLRR